jgi:hypothetical protein
MGARPMRVVVWATGGIGSIAIPAIHRRPDLELVGVRVYAPSKVGRDAGEIANGEPIGIAATDDVDALLALAPDCIVYAASPPTRDAGTTEDYVRFLEAGINVVSTSTTGAVYPAAYAALHRDRIQAAGERGGATFYASGIEPGFAADHLPALLLTQSSTVRSVYATELALYDDYPVPDVMMHGLGFGMPLDSTPAIASPGAILASWGAPLGYLAAALGVELDDRREVFDRRATGRRLDVAFGAAEAGTCGAVLIQAIGVVDGRDAIVVEHVTRLASDVAPEWPIGEHPITYRIRVEGEPNISCELGLSVDDPVRSGIPDMTSGAGPMVATAMRVINAIPYVVDARPGMVSSLDLPLTTPRHAFVGGA